MAFTNDLTSEGIASASSIFNSSQDAAKAIDDNLTTQWAADDSGFPYWWQIDFGSGNEKTIEKYTIRSRNDSFWEEIPEDWTLEASNTGNFTGEEVVLDTRSGIVWTQDELKEFLVDNNIAYRYYRINITDNQSTSSTNTSLLEVEMMEALTEHFNINEIVTFSDTNVLDPTNLDFIVNEVLSFSETNNLNIPLNAKFLTGIDFTNPLFAVTDTDPAQIIKFDISTPSSPTFSKQDLAGAKNAKDVVINSNTGFVYVACADGILVKVDINDLTNQEIINLSDTDELITVDSNDSNGIIYASTDNSTGELYLIDERETFKIDSDFQLLTSNQFLLDTDFAIFESFKIDTDFNVLATETFKINTDFKVISAPIDQIDPIGELDYQVFVDGSQLDSDDIILESISITHSVDQESVATFNLARQHDNPNKTLTGNTSNISSQNTVEIKCNGRTIFPLNPNATGRIGRITATYSDNEEVIIVQAFSKEATNKFNSVTLSLPSFDERLSLYNVLIQEPDIFNPFIDPDNEDDPKKFKGIRVDLGTEITKRQSRLLVFDTTGSIAEEIQDGTFEPKQNNTYFWSPSVQKFGNFSVNDSSNTPTADSSSEFSQINLSTFRFGGVTPFTNIADGDTSIIHFKYIGTSIFPVSADLWNLSNAKHRRQRLFEDKEEELGVYEAGEAPFKEISVRNGRFNTSFRYIDEPDGLYSVKEEGNDFTEFAKRVADLELKKLQNINGDILPETSCSLSMTIDAFLYYQLKLLTRLNIDNTVETNVYNGNNGFPVSIKSITITSIDRKVSIEADNLKSVKELEVINSQFPDDEDDEFIDPEKRIFVAQKSDMKTRLDIE